MRERASIEREGFKLPLMGFPPAAVLQECALCRDCFPLRDVLVRGDQFLCPKCRKMVEHGSVEGIKTQIAECFCGCLLESV